jgi:uncharacterized metal-binding protein YceD (DUF177 family)
MTDPQKPLSPVTGEFSRVVPTGRLGKAAAHHVIAASPEERAALARRFDLLAIDRFEATVELKRRADGTVRFEAQLSADIVQACVVTLEPVSACVEDRFSVIFDPEIDEDAADALALENPEDEFREPLVDDSIDIGEVVAQQLSVIMDPYPRRPDSLPAIAETGSGSGAEAILDARNPFAILAALKKQP